MPFRSDRVGMRARVCTYGGYRFGLCVHTFAYGGFREGPCVCILPYGRNYVGVATATTSCLICRTGIVLPFSKGVSCAQTFCRVV